MLELRLLGGLEVVDPAGRPLDVSSKKARALLAYLSAQPGKRHTREHVASLLWGDISADEHARRSLRQALSVLRKVLPARVIDAERDDLGVIEASVRSDVHELENALRLGDRESLGRAVALYRGDFLEGFSARADGFDDWADHERTRLRERALEAMERLGRLERDAGRLEAAITLAMRVVALEPLRESAHRDLMELHVAAHAPGRALKQYETCKKLLARELGIAPSAATAALAARIRADPAALAAPLAQASGAPAGPSLRQIVVVHVATGWDDMPSAHEGRSEVRRISTRAQGRVLRDTPDAQAFVFGTRAARGSTIERAVRAALELAHRLETLGLGRRIGVASGQALVDDAAGGLVVQGEVVSLASSLHQVGSLVISGAVRASLGDRAEVRECSRVRGATAFELVGLADADSPRSALVGRDFELAALVASLEPCLATGRGRACVVRGEPGIGKTTLVAHFCLRARQAGFDVHRQHVLDFGLGTETDLLDALARSLLLDSSGGDVEAALARAVERGDLAPGDLGFARQMLGAPDAERSQLDAGPDETTRRQDAILGKLLRASSRRRAVLVCIEDIHWAPPATLCRLTRLMATVATCRALLVMTTRIVGEPDDAEWRRAIKGRAVSTLDLAPLDDEAARTLVDQLFRGRGRGVAAADAAEILERASGNPLFLEQLCWADSPAAVPGSVHALVQSRLDALEPSSRRVLEAAAVLGQQLEESALAGVLDVGELDSSELVEHGLLCAEPGGLAFTHALVRDAVYGSLPDDRRCLLHLAAARHYADKSKLLRAGHLERARDPAAPAAYLDAAEEQRRRGGMAPALELAERALALAVDDGDLHRLSHFRGEVLRELGRADEALAAFDAARERSHGVDERARAWLGTASVLRLLDHPAEAFQALERAGRLIDADAMPELASHVHFMRGNVLFPSGDADACLQEHRRALDLAQKARSALAEAQALGGMADAHYVAGRMRSATELFERCEVLAAREGLTHIERTSRGMRLVMQVLFLRARETAERCLAEARRAEEAGALRAVAFLETGACMALGYLGEWQRMAEAAQAAAELTRRLGARRFEALSLAYLGIARFQLGESHREQLARALELSMASGMAFSSGIVHAGFVATAQDADAVRYELGRGLAALDAGSIAHGRIVFLTHAIMAAIRLRDANEARRLADELERGLEENCELASLFVELGRGATASAAARAREAGLVPVVELLG